ncbi:MAG: 50S ribosomal protein L11 methyltransferase [Thermoanaerobaculia bacterium]|nr:50S ribosomal protein L11 methyltransferase [Thermoanaerobaculia bacterium]MCZ7650239.1 50S ribosomal protein L11 methyltransferase [Thermoanaerobaculia bacterium]
MLRVPAGSEEEVAARLWPLAPLGLEWRSGPAGDEAVAFFTADDPVTGLAALPFEVLSDRLLPVADWLAAWRAAARPIRVGRSLLVDPREPEPEDEGAVAEAGRATLRLPARTAFGVGSHESTRLAWELAEELGLAAGARALDVGCGTGILAFGAELAGALWAGGFDVDPAAALLAGQYARLNGLPGRFFAGGAAALAAPSRFDLLFVNVIPTEIGPDLAALCALLAPEGTAVFSGILEAEAGEAAARLAAAGFEERARRVEGEWAALACAGR